MRYEHGYLKADYAFVQQSQPRHEQKPPFNVGPQNRHHAQPGTFIDRSSREVLMPDGSTFAQPAQAPPPAVNRALWTGDQAPQQGRQPSQAAERNSKQPAPPKQDSAGKRQASRGEEPKKATQSKKGKTKKENKSRAASAQSSAPISRKASEVALTMAPAASKQQKEQKTTVPSIAEATSTAQPPSGPVEPSHVDSHAPPPPVEDPTFDGAAEAPAKDARASLREKREASPIMEALVEKLRASSREASRRGSRDTTPDAEAVSNGSPVKRSRRSPHVSAAKLASPAPATAGVASLADWAESVEAELMPKPVVRLPSPQRDELAQSDDQSALKPESEANEREAPTSVPHHEVVEKSPGKQWLQLTRTIAPASDKVDAPDHLPTTQAESSPPNKSPSGELVTEAKSTDTEVAKNVLSPPLSVRKVPEVNTADQQDSNSDAKPVATKEDSISTAPTKKEVQPEPKSAPRESGYAAVVQGSKNNVSSLGEDEFPTLAAAAELTKTPKRSTNKQAPEPPAHTSTTVTRKPSLSLVGKNKHIKPVVPVVPLMKLYKRSKSGLQQFQTEFLKSDASLGHSEGAAEPTVVETSISKDLKLYEPSYSSTKQEKNSTAKAVESKSQAQTKGHEASKEDMAKPSAIKDTAGIVDTAKPSHLPTKKAKRGKPSLSITTPDPAAASPPEPSSETLTPYSAFPKDRDPAPLNEIDDSRLQPASTATPISTHKKSTKRKKRSPRPSVKDVRGEAAQQKQEQAPKPEAEKESQPTESYDPVQSIEGLAPADPTAPAKSTEESPKGYSMKTGDIQPEAFSIEPQPSEPKSKGYSLKAGDIKPEVFETGYKDQKPTLNLREADRMSMSGLDTIGDYLKLKTQPRLTKSRPDWMYSHEVWRIIRHHQRQLRKREPTKSEMIREMEKAGFTGEWDTIAANADRISDDGSSGTLNAGSEDSSHEDQSTKSKKKFNKKKKGKKNKGKRAQTAPNEGGEGLRVKDAESLAVESPRPRKTVAMSYSAREYGDRENKQPSYHQELLNPSTRVPILRGEASGQGEIDARPVIYTREAEDSDDYDGPSTPKKPRREFAFKPTPTRRRTERNTDSGSSESITVAGKDYKDPSLIQNLMEEHVEHHTESRSTRRQKGIKQQNLARLRRKDGSNESLRASPAKASRQKTIDTLKKPGGYLDLTGIGSSSDDGYAKPSTDRIRKVLENRSAEGAMKTSPQCSSPGSDTRGGPRAHDDAHVPGTDQSCGIRTRRTATTMEIDAEGSMIPNEEDVLRVAPRDDRRFFGRLIDSAKTERSSRDDVFVDSSGPNTGFHTPLTSRPPELVLLPSSSSSGTLSPGPSSGATLPGRRRSSQLPLRRRIAGTSPSGLRGGIGPKSSSPSNGETFHTPRVFSSPLEGAINKITTTISEIQTRSGQKSAPKVPEAPGLPSVEFDDDASSDTGTASKRRGKVGSPSQPATPERPRLTSTDFNVDISPEAQKICESISRNASPVRSALSRTPSPPRCAFDPSIYPDAKKISKALSRPASPSEPAGSSEMGPSAPIDFGEAMMRAHEAGSGRSRSPKSRRSPKASPRPTRAGPSPSAAFSPEMFPGLERRDSAASVSTAGTGSTVVGSAGKMLFSEIARTSSEGAGASLPRESFANSSSAAVGLSSVFSSSILVVVRNSSADGSLQGPTDITNGSRSRRESSRRGKENESGSAWALPKGGKVWGNEN